MRFAELSPREANTQRRWQRASQKARPRKDPQREAILGVWIKHDWVDRQIDVKYPPTTRSERLKFFRRRIRVEAKKDIEKSRAALAQARKRRERECLRLIDLYALALKTLREQHEKQVAAKGWMKLVRCKNQLTVERGELDGWVRRLGSREAVVEYFSSRGIIA